MKGGTLGLKIRLSYTDFWSPVSIEYGAMPKPVTKFMIGPRSRFLNPLAPK